MSRAWGVRSASVAVLSALALAVSGPVGGAATAHPPAYTFTDLGSLGTGLSSHAFAIGASGIVVGHADTSLGKYRGFHAMAWWPDRPRATTGTLVDLLAGRPENSVAWGVDRHGVVAGTLVGAESTPDRAFVYDRKLRVLPRRGNRSAAASDINDYGQVVGYVRTARGIKHAALWYLAPGRPARLVDLGVPRRWVASSAAAISDSGLVAGTLFDRRYFGHAALWRPARLRGGKGSWKVIATPPGFQYVAITDANRHGVLAGSGVLRSQRDRALVGPPGHLDRYLPLPGGGHSYALAINAAGVAVGYADNAHEDRAVLYRDGRTIDLNGSLTPQVRQLGYVLRIATAVNDRGQIVGTAFVHGTAHAFLLTPTR